MVTEVWDTTFSYNRNIEPPLTSYELYPVVFLVPYNFEV